MPTLGVEEEFVLLDPRTGAAACVAPRVLELTPAADGELMTYQVETATDVCRDLGEVRRQLLASRSALADAAASAGALLAASGTAPFARPGLEALTPDTRYARLAEQWPDLVRDAGSAGCHIHVGLENHDVGALVLGRLRPWLPALLALSTNSPFVDGRDQGWASSRYRMWSRLPSAVPPPVVTTAAAYEEVVARTVHDGDAVDPKSVYHLARLSPAYPTLEMRVADVCLTVDDAVLLTGLVRALICRCAADAEASAPPRHASDEALLQRSLSSVAREGLSGEVVHPEHGATVTGWDLVDELVTFVSPQLAANGDSEEIFALLGELRAVGSGADRQRRWAAQGASPADVVHRVAEATLAAASFGDPSRLACAGSSTHTP